MSKTKRQHYIPQFLLKYHSEKAKNNYFIYQYDKLENKEIRTNIKNVGVENYLYEFRDMNRKIINENLIEKLLSNFESSWAIIVNKLIKNPKVYLTENEKALLYLLLIVQFIRTPCNISIMVKYFKKDVNVDDILLRNLALYSAFGKTFPLDEKTNNLFQNIAFEFMKYDLVLFHNNSKSDFILNDSSPVCLFGLMNPDVYFLPISKDLALGLNNKHETSTNIVHSSLNVINLNCKQAEFLNNTALEKTERFVYSYQSIKKRLENNSIKRLISHPDILLPWQFKKIYN